MELRSMLYSGIILSSVQAAVIVDDAFIEFGDDSDFVIQLSQAPFFSPPYGTFAMGANYTDANAIFFRNMGSNGLSNLHHVSNGDAFNSSYVEMQSPLVGSGTGVTSPVISLEVGESRLFGYWSDSRDQLGVYNAQSDEGDIYGWFQLENNLTEGLIITSGASAFGNGVDGIIVGQALSIPETNTSLLLSFSLLSLLRFRKR